MSEQLRGKRIAFLVVNEGVEQVELTEPLEAVREAGGLVLLGGVANPDQLRTAGAAVEFVRGSCGTRREQGKGALGRIEELLAQLDQRRRIEREVLRLVCSKAERP